MHFANSLSVEKTMKLLTCFLLAFSAFLIAAPPLLGGQDEEGTAEAQLVLQKIFIAQNDCFEKHLKFATSLNDLVEQGFLKLPEFKSVKKSGDSVRVENFNFTQTGYWVGTSFKIIWPVLSVVWW